MRSRLQKRSKKTGLSPGSLIHIGQTYTEKARINFIYYNEADFEAKEVSFLSDLPLAEDRPGIIWVNIDGLQDTKLLEDIGNHFRLHPLVLEDVLNTDQRPKMEDYGDYLYIVLRNFNIQSIGDLSSEQVSIILGKNFVLSFREKQSNIFAAIEGRLRSSKGRIRKAGADYLTHAIIDNIVDNYFIVLENIEEKIESLEDILVKRPPSSTISSIHNLKRELILLRKSLWPLREAVSALGRSDTPLISKTTSVYFKDIFDHVIGIIDSIETFREMLSGLLDIYLSFVSNKLNEIMKVLAIIATIFMPLTFLAGIYGMNFKFMPELNWHGGYFAVLGIMLLIAVLMICYFKKKRWF